MSRHLLLLSLSVIGLGIGAAQAAPPAKGAAAAKPATPTKSADEPIDTSTGTTIIGDQESPIGLYITPWKDEYAERGLDRPARLLDEALLPIDPATFRRQVEYYESITAFQRSQRPAGN